MLNFEKGFTLDLDLKTGLSKKVDTKKRYLSDLRGMFADDAALEAMIKENDDVIYEYHTLPVPEHEGDLAFGSSIVYPGNVAGEYFMTKGHFHTILGTAEVYYCMNGQGVMLCESPEGDVKAFELSPGTVVYVPKRYAHRSINTGNTPLHTFYVYRADAGHDYGTIEEKGFRKLYVEKDGTPTLVENPKWAE
ncbi:MAG TPA: glucose-6-phosphate isomerase [Fastidiosipila sp.]|nr:glucose-6-phosphate isomerase [Fastidiosipila sp.]